MLLLIACLILISGCTGNKAAETAANADVSADDISKQDNILPYKKNKENPVYINHFVFEPQELTVPVGTKVTWIHNDNVAHTIVLPGAFESDVLKRGDEFSFTFGKPGEYAYHCSIHPSMEGSIIVR